MALFLFRSPAHDVMYFGAQMFGSREGGTRVMQNVVHASPL